MTIIFYIYMVIKNILQKIHLNSRILNYLIFKGDSNPNDKYALSERAL